MQRVLLGSRRLPGRLKPRHRRGRAGTRTQDRATPGPRLPQRRWEGLRQTSAGVLPVSAAPGLTALAPPPFSVSPGLRPSFSLTTPGLHRRLVRGVAEPWGAGGGRVRVCACAYVRVRVCVHVCVRARVCVRVGSCACARACDLS